MLSIRVDNRLRFEAASVPEWATERLKDQFTYANPAYGKAVAMGFWAGKIPRFVSTWQQRAGEFSLPRGGSVRLREILAEAGVEYRFDVKVCAGLRAAFPAHSVTLEPFQEQAVEAILRKQNCILKSPTGSGKTTIAINLISRLQRTTLVMLWTGPLLKQWLDRLVGELGMRRQEVGVIGLGKFEVKPLTLAMQQTVHSLIKRGDPRFAPILDYFGLFIGDELQRWGADTLVECTDPFPAQYRVGMSGDHTRHDHREFLIHDEFGTIAADVDQDELVANGVILDVLVRVVFSDFEADWYREEFLEDGRPNPDYKNFTRVLDEMCSDEARNAMVADVVAQASQGGGVLVFSHRVAHCQMLDRTCVAKGIQSGLMLGGEQWGHAFDETKRGLMARKLRVGIGTFEAIGQAIDVPAVSRGVVATPINYNRQKFGQVRGRMCRANRAGSTDAELWYVLDRKVFGLGVLRNLVQWNNRVLVQDGGGWVEGKEFLAQAKRQRSMFEGG